MKFIIFLFLLSILENKCDEISYESHDGLQGPREAQVEWFPYQAVILGEFCAGILISEQYVITSAWCVRDYPNVTVHLGFRGYPTFESSRNEKNTQTYRSHNVIVHENYQSVGNINNIALVKLSETVIVNEKVSPAKLFSNKEMYPMENTFANLSGWIYGSNNSNMHFETVKILSQDTCRSYYGSDLIESQELCAEFASSRTSLDLHGNALRLNNKIVGFQTFQRICIKDNSSCQRTGLFLNLIPFLGWISGKTNISIKKLIRETEENSSKMLGIDDLFELIQESQIILKQEIANNNDRMKRLLEEFERTKEKMLERLSNVKENEELRISNLEKKIDSIQETVDSILQENSVTKLNFEKQLEQVLKVSEEMNIKFKKILEFLSRKIGTQ